MTTEPDGTMAGENTGLRGVVRKAKARRKGKQAAAPTDAVTAAADGVIGRIEPVRVPVEVLAGGDDGVREPVRATAVAAAPEARGIVGTAESPPEERHPPLPVGVATGTTAVDAPERPPRSAHLTVTLVGVMAAAFGAWAFFSQLDIVSMASGEVIPSSQVKTVQHLEGGIVREILVREGTRVTAGQSLVVLEPTVSGADVGELRVRLNAFTADVARLDALAKGHSAPAFPPGFAEANPELARNSESRFQSQLRRFRSDIKRQQETIVQREEEAREITARIENGRRGLALVREQIAISEGLLVNTLTNRFQHLELLKEGQRLQGGIVADTSALERIKGAAMEARAELDRIKGAFAEEVQKVLDEARLGRDEIAERVKKYEDSFKRTVVRSPVDGIVKTLKVVTVGGVLRPGDTVADIVPADDHLMIEAKLPTADIGYVRKGQPAIVKLASADAMRFGDLHGTVTHVSPDTLFNKDGMPFYKVRIDTEKDHFQHGDRRFNLFPGMQVVASIQTGKRTVLDFVLDPFLYSMGNAAQER